MDWVLLIHVWDSPIEGAGSRYLAIRFNTQKAAKEAAVWYEAQDSNTQTHIVFDAGA